MKRLHLTLLGEIAHFFENGCTLRIILARKLVPVEVGPNKMSYSDHVYGSFCDYILPYQNLVPFLLIHNMFRVFGEYKCPAEFVTIVLFPIVGFSV